MTGSWNTRSTAVVASLLMLAWLLVGCSDSSGEPAVESPSPSITSAPSAGSTTTTGSTASSASTPPSVGPPEVRLEALPFSFEQPVYLTAAPGDASRLFVVEKGGRVRMIVDGSLAATPFLDLVEEVSDGGEQGLLSMAFHPDFQVNGRLFVNFTDTSGATRVVGFTLADPRAEQVDAGSRTELLEIAQPYSNHNGGQLQFGPDGLLYVGMGDGGSGGDPEDRAQDGASLLGKLLRLDVDQPKAASNAPEAEVFALGLRNPWRFSFDEDTGDLWIGDVGQGDWEEIDFLPAGTPPGTNFGWNAYEGSHPYDQDSIDRLGGVDVVWPVFEYDHSVGNSVTGGYVYRGSRVPALRGHYVCGDFSSGRVWTMDGPDSSAEPLSGADRELQQISSFGEDADGELYIISLSGTVYRVLPPQ